MTSLGYGKAVFAGEYGKFVPSSKQVPIQIYA